MAVMVAEVEVEVGVGGWAWMVCWFEEMDGVDGVGEEEEGLAVPGWVSSSSSSSSAS
jgi:hypothetical protein